MKQMMKKYLYMAAVAVVGTCLTENRREQKMIVCTAYQSFAFLG